MWLLHQFESLIHLGECKEYPIMAKTKTPRTTSPRSKKTVTSDAAVTPIAPAVVETPAVATPAAVIPAAAPRAEVRASEPVAALRAETRTKVEEPRKIVAEPRRAVAPINLEEEIRRRAYQLYEERGRMPGYENEDWLVAEREILSRHSASHQASA
jgi:hypothetical protein